MNRLVPSSWRLFFQKTLVRLMRQNGDFARLHARTATRFFMVTVSASALKCLCSGLRSPCPSAAMRRFPYRDRQLIDRPRTTPDASLVASSRQCFILFGLHAQVLGARPLKWRFRRTKVFEVEWWTQEDDTLTATSVNTAMFHPVWTTCASVGC